MNARVRASGKLSGPRVTVALPDLTHSVSVVPKMNHVQKARARGGERLRFFRAAKDAVALEQGAYSHEGVKQHLGSASIRAQVRRKLGGRGALPERREHV